MIPSSSRRRAPVALSNLDFDISDSKSIFAAQIDQRERRVHEDCFTDLVESFVTLEALLLIPLPDSNTLYSACVHDDTKNPREAHDITT